jgi:DNA-binding XRE family transcriptional regulator
MSTEIPGEAPPFAAEVKARRDRMKMSQARLAELADISESGLRRIEKGWEKKTIAGEETSAKVTPSIKVLIKLATALDWDVTEAAELAGYDTRRLPDLPTVAVESTEPPHMITKLWPDLTTKQQNLLNDVAAEFAANNRRISARARTDNRTEDALHGDPSEMKISKKR